MLPEADAACHEAYPEFRVNLKKVLDRATVEGLDPSCAAEYERPPFAVD